METEALVGGIIGILIGLVIFLVLVLIFRWLWNTTVPDVFGAKQLSFGQSIKILLLASILFGGHRVVDVPQEVSHGTAPAAAQSK